MENTSLEVIQCHWSYFVSLHFKAIQFIQAIEETVWTGRSLVKWLLMWTKPYGLDTREQHIWHSPDQVGRLGFLSPLNVSSRPYKTLPANHTLWNEMVQSNSSDIELLCSNILSNNHLQNLVGVKHKLSLWTIPDLIFKGAYTASNNAL